MQRSQEERVYGSQIERLEELEEFGFEAYLDFVGKASRAFSIAHSRQDVDYEQDNIEVIELPGNWDQQYSLKEMLEEAREAGDRFSDFFRFLDNEVSPNESSTYTSAEAVKLCEVVENFNRLDSKYRTAVTNLENIQQQIGPKREHERPQFSFDDVSYEDIVELGSASEEKVLNKK